MQIIQAESIEQIKTAKELFLEYARSLNFELCFQDFDKELEGLPGEYAPPSGRLFLVLAGGNFAGCIALRKIDEGICEMKRLYVKPGFRGQNIGKILAERLIKAAKEIGYKKMRLDTVPGMETAQKLYKSLGFYEIESYRVNPVPGAIFMEVQL